MEKFTNLENIMELQADLMDGRTKYIAPQPSKDLIIKKQILAKYNKIITYANNSGFNVSKDIHELEIGDESYYYVTIKETDDKTWRKGIEYAATFELGMKIRRVLKAQGYASVEAEF